MALLPIVKKEGLSLRRRDLRIPALVLVKGRKEYRKRFGAFPKYEIERFSKDLA